MPADDDLEAARRVQDDDDLVEKLRRGDPPDPGDDLEKMISAWVSESRKGKR